MASITVRGLDDAVKAKLRIRAAHHGWSMEEEVRAILRKALAEKDNRAANLATAIRRRFGPLGGVDLPPREQETVPAPPDFRA